MAEAIPSASSGMVSAGHAAGRAGVLLPLPLSGAYDYAVPQGVTRGEIVRAPLGKRELLGIVWGKAHGDVAPEKLRMAVALEGRPHFPPALCDFIDWVARYTLAPPGAVLAQAMRAHGAFDAEIPRPAFRIGATKLERLTPARARVLALMQDGMARSASDIAEQAGVSPGVVKGLADTEALVSLALPEFDRLPVPDTDFEGVTLSPDQARAAAHLSAAVKAREFSAHLLD